MLIRVLLARIQPLLIRPNVSFRILSVLSSIVALDHTESPLSDNGRLVAKTRTQLNRKLTNGKRLPWPPFGKQWYAGCTTLIVGNSVKAGIRTSHWFHDRGL